MKYLMLLFLVGCGFTGSVDLGGSNRVVTCKMNNFNQFPSKITGKVTLELKNFLTIVVFNKDKTEKVEITFPKEKCNG